MPTDVNVTNDNPFKRNGSWFFKDEKGLTRGPYATLGRATIGMGKYIRDHIEPEAPRNPLTTILMIVAVILAGYLITHAP